MNDITVNDIHLRLLVNTVGMNEISPTDHSIIIQEPALHIPLKLREPSVISIHVSQLQEKWKMWKNIQEW